MTDQPTWPAKYACPHCGAEYKSGFAQYESRPQLQYCYEDEGGCGATFAVSSEVRVTVTAVPRKIEGLGPIDQDYAAELYQNRLEEKATS
jgi:hypothetical protein